MIDSNPWSAKQFPSHMAWVNPWHTVFRQLLDVLLRVRLCLRLSVCVNVYVHVHVHVHVCVCMHACMCVYVVMILLLSRINHVHTKHE